MSRHRLLSVESTTTLLVPRLLVAWLVVIAFVAVGCASLVGDEADEFDRQSDGSSRASSERSDRQWPDAGEVEFVALVDDVELFWSEEASDIDLEYQQFDRSRFFLRSEIENGLFVGCEFDGDVEELTGDSVADNAYVAICDEGITLVVDDESYIPELVDQYGSVGPAILLAHEWGHIIQYQLSRFDQSAIIAEQQADCYTGAYIAWAEDNQVEPFVEAEARDLAILSTLETRDELGTSADNEDAHGNGFDRIRATQDGYDRGVSFCAAFDESPPTITQIPFFDDEDQSSGGNVKFAEANDELEQETREYFSTLTVEPLESVVELPSRRELRELYDSVGDNAIGTAYARAYGEAVQELEGEATTGEGASLQRACLVGSWLHWLLNSSDEEGPIGGDLSPGDLDESIQTYSSSDDLLDNPGLVFELVASLRLGTIEGIGACALG